MSFTRPLWAALPPVRVKLVASTVRLSVMPLMCVAAEISVGARPGPSEATLAQAVVAMGWMSLARQTPEAGTSMSARTTIRSFSAAESAV